MGWSGRSNWTIKVVLLLAAAVYRDYKGCAKWQSCNLQIQVLPKHRPMTVAMKIRPPRNLRTQCAFSLQLAHTRRLGFYLMG